jgi:phenylpyruvate tautomerase PptA (4-oxalocrotonate tautomerase family)
MVRVSLRQGHPEWYKQTLSQVIQSALERCFDVPPGDCFQLFDEYGANQRVIDPCYQSPGRSKDYMLIEIKVGRPRTLVQKQGFYRTLAELCQHHLQLSAADLMIIISSTAPEDWSFSQGVIGQSTPEEEL